MSECPHEDKQYCPLYVAGHTANGGGCWPAEPDGCSCDAGHQDYAKALGALIAAGSPIPAECEWRQAKTEADAQRNRNMRTAGIH